MKCVNLPSIPVMWLALALQAPAALAQDDGTNPQIETIVVAAVQDVPAFDDQAIRKELKGRSERATSLAIIDARDAAREAASEFARQIARSVIMDLAEATADGDVEESAAGFEDEGI